MGGGAPSSRIGAVARGHDGAVTISAEQRDVHVVFEALAVAVAAPFSFWLATRSYLPTWARVVSGAIGAATVLVDGGLLLSYSRED